LHDIKIGRNLIAFNAQICLNAAKSGGWSVLYTGSTYDSSDFLIIWQRGKEK